MIEQTQLSMYNMMIYANLTGAKLPRLTEIKLLQAQSKFSQLEFNSLQLAHPGLIRGLSIKLSMSYN